MTTAELSQDRAPEIQAIQQKAAGSSFYTAMRLMPKAEREGMFAIYAFCRAVDDIADEGIGTRAERRTALDAWRNDLVALYAGGDGGRAAFLKTLVARYGLRKEDFLTVIDGMDMDVARDICAPDLATLDLYCDRVASAVGRLSIKVFGMEEGPGFDLAYHLGRALQLTNILRDLDEDAAINRLYLPREYLEAAGIAPGDPVAAIADLRIDQTCRAVAALAHRHYGEANRVMAARPKGRIRTPRLMGAVYSEILTRDRKTRLGAAAPPGILKQAEAADDRRCERPVRVNSVVVIGAGLSGLAAAVALAKNGARVRLIEGAGQAGGRCRSYFDPVLNQTIDNGNHLILSGNHATFDYLRTIGAADKLAGPDAASFDFMDVRDGTRWTIRANDGPIAWWILSPARRVPGSSLGEYFALARLLAPSPGKRVDETIACKGAVWEKLLRPLLLAALNTEPETASVGLAAAIIRETLAKGGRAYRPRIASPMLSAAFVDPALAYLSIRGASVHFGSRLREIVTANGRVTALNLADGEVAISEKDRVVLATPPWVTAELLPDIAVPTEFRPIVNAHFALPPPPGASPMTGVIGGTAEWVFAFHDRLSVTISGADAVVDQDRETLAQALWRDVAAVHRLGPDLPPWQIVKERRATFAATPEQAKKRAGTETAWQNLFLAGDWTDTGLPATIEGAVRSGQRAAMLALRAVA